MKIYLPKAREFRIPTAVFWVVAFAFLFSVPAGASGPITEFPIPTAGAQSLGITAGPDGNIWFCEGNATRIGRATPDGSITEFSTSLYPFGIVRGPDGNLWYTASNSDDFDPQGVIGRISPSGEETEFPVSAPCDIAAGPDGNLWFTQCAFATNRIGRITPSGTVTSFELPRGIHDNPLSIVSGPDGSLWYTKPAAAKVGRITTSGSVTEFALPEGSYPATIVAGPDGNLWFAADPFTGDTRIGRITTNGEVTKFPIVASSLVTGPDGNLWFADTVGNRVGRLSIASGTAVVDLAVAVPTAGAFPFRIASGPDGNIWFTESQGNKIGRVDLSAVCGSGTLCLGGRFQVTAAWRNGSSSGTGTPAGVTPNVGSFSFFDPANVEVFVKILNACPSTGHFGVYVNGLTHLGVTVTVTDLRTGVSRDFVNPTGSPFSLIFDGSTFACP